MLGKLIKHECKSTYKVFCGLLLVVFVVTILSMLSLNAPMWTNMFAGREVKRMTSLDVLAIMMLVTYIFSLAGIAIAFFIYMGVHFHRTMYTEQGYLTHTLPVSSHQLFISKILVNGLWYLAICIAVTVSVIAWVYMLMNNIYIGEGGKGSLLTFLMDNKENLAEVIKEIFGMRIGKEFIILMIIFPISTMASITILFGSITIGQLSGKYKVLMSIVSYIIISIVLSIIGGIISIPVSLRQTVDLLENDISGFGLGASTWISVTVSIVAAVILYLVSNYIVTKKLNLE